MFLVGFLDFSLYVVNDIYNVTYLSILDFLISFSCLVAVTRTSKAMLNKNGKSWNHYLTPDLRRNAFDFLSFSILLTGGLSYIDFNM